MKRLLVTAFAVVLSACAAPVHRVAERSKVVTPQKKSQPRIVVPISSEQEEGAKKIISATLKDPYTAVFDGVYGTSIARDNPKATVICGMVNAKNSYGGYIGSQKFAVIGGNPYVWSSTASGIAQIDNEFISTVCTAEKT